MSSVYFNADSLCFLRDLGANNDRDWFKANKARYEASVRQPFLRLLRDLQAPLRAQLPAFVADPRPLGGSLFRIHRDTRFSNDKRPYKTHAGAAIKHRDGMDGSPLLYFHLAADGCFFGAGIYHPPAPVLRQLRDFIVDNPRAWTQARAAVLQAGLSFGGDSLTRPPRGFPPDHPLIEDLKRKDFIVTRPVDDALACSDRLLPWLVDCAVQAQPLLEYQCAALELSLD